LSVVLAVFGFSGVMVAKVAFVALAVTDAIDDSTPFVAL
jgi:hypothetical protein